MENCRYRSLGSRAILKFALATLVPQMANDLMQRFRYLPKKSLGLSSGALLTLYYLCDLANKNTHIAFPAIATIAEEIGLSSVQVRRHTHLLESKGLLKIVENRYGGAKGKSCRYKITLPTCTRKKTESTIEKTTIADARHASHSGTSTTLAHESQTIQEPYITNKDLIRKFGLGWNKNPDTAYKVGLFIGVHAAPGEDNYSFVNRIYMKLKQQSSSDIGIFAH